MNQNARDQSTLTLCRAEFLTLIRKADQLLIKVGELAVETSFRYLHEASMAMSPTDRAEVNWHRDRGGRGVVTVYAIQSSNARALPIHSFGTTFQEPQQPPRFSVLLTAAQLDAVADAAEFTNRFCSGQIDIGTLPRGLSRLGSIKLGERVHAIKTALGRLKTVLFPQLAPAEHMGVGHQSDDQFGYYRDTLYEVYRTILEFQTMQQAATNLPMYGNVYAHAGLQYTKEAKPVITQLLSPLNASAETATPPVHGHPESAD